MAGFTKLFASITESSIWTSDDRTLRVWIAMLARANADGIVEGSIPGFASLCRMQIEDFERALAELSGPDRYSRTTDHEGRRIAAVPGGWRILNYLSYRERGQSKDGSRAPYFREYRQKRKGLAPVARNKRNSATVARNTEAEAEAEGGAPPDAPAPQTSGIVNATPTLPPPTIAEAREFGARCGAPLECTEKWFWLCDSRQWREKDSDRPIGNWQSSLRSFAVSWRGIEGRRVAGNGTPPPPRRLAGPVRNPVDI